MALILIKREQSRWQLCDWSKKVIIQLQRTGE